MAGAAQAIEFLKAKPPLRIHDRVVDGIRTWSVGFETIVGQRGAISLYPNIHICGYYDIVKIIL